MVTGARPRANIVALKLRGTSNCLLSESVRNCWVSKWCGLTKQDENDSNDILVWNSQETI